ncbi:glycine cleavage system aminomethyltransferase GcvT [Rothia sp. P100]|uniref:glycine cleavage system aminomethyltransferase GcvT n=1 Tax=unclassified Rothia (in: high G+C Gram-positive bacteria) TaxID=2689056 RepID=UPI00203C9771|nr:glycine cleavage system aminomethyltransferase GcvT [Rothia sp. P100]MCM3509677.1 glycine cleavage system aminomethyltransferase GcvT [Rothia sp. P100]
MTPKKTALYTVHEQLGASFTDFGGWDMPLKYTNDVEEHKTVRNAAGLFDLSHMGEFRVKGADAGAYLDYVLLSNMSILKVGKAKYSLLLNEDGGVIDDLITYRLADDEFLVVPNAANVDVDFEAFQERLGDFDVTLTNETADTSLVAVQGPAAEAILLDMAPDSPETITSMGYYAAAPVLFGNIQTLVARTGYTGEDGFEIYVPNQDAEALWNLAATRGEAHGALPAGLAARDSLRLEAGMPLYGHELGLDIAPAEAGMGKLVEIALSKKTADFVGKEAVAAQAENAPARTLIGLKAQGKRPARAGSKIVDEAGNSIGEITSGIPSPTLGYPIALALMNTEHAHQGTTVNVDIRGKAAPFDIVPTPFYQREK